MKACSSLIDNMMTCRFMMTSRYIVTYWYMMTYRYIAKYRYMMTSRYIVTYRYMMTSRYIVTYRYMTTSRYVATYRYIMTSRKYCDVWVYDGAYIEIMPHHKYICMMGHNFPRINIFVYRVRDPYRHGRLIDWLIDLVKDGSTSLDMLLGYFLEIIRV